MAYRYQTPRSQQYQSTFVPLPLDYLNQAMLSRQQSYDQNYQNMLAAEDKYAALETAPEWTAEKTRVLDEAFGNIQKTVQDKYGGDYSQATNEIMSSIVGLRKNPLWNYAAQDLVDYKQKKAQYDHLVANNQLGYAEGFDGTTKIKDSNGNYTLPKRQVYAKLDLNPIYQKKYNSLFNDVYDNKVASDIPGQFKIVKTKGADRSKIEKDVTLDDAIQILDENVVLQKQHPEWVANPELFRQQIVDDIDKSIARTRDAQYVTNRDYIDAPTAIRNRQDQEQFDRQMQWNYDQLAAKNDKNSSNSDGSSSNNMFVESPVRLDPSIIPYKKFLSMAESDPSLQDKLNPMIQSLGKKFGITGLNTLSDLTKLDEDTYHNNPMLRAPKIIGQSIIDAATGGDAVKTLYDKENKDLFLRPKINAVKKELEENYEFLSPTAISPFQISPLMAEDSPEITKINANKREVNDYILTNIKNFQVSGENEKQSAKIIEKIDDLVSKKGTDTSVETKDYMVPNSGKVFTVIDWRDGKNKGTIIVEPKPSAMESTNEILLGKFIRLDEGFRNSMKSRSLKYYSSKWEDQKKTNNKLSLDREDFDSYEEFELYNDYELQRAQSKPKLRYNNVNERFNQ